MSLEAYFWSSRWGVIIFYSIFKEFLFKLILKVVLCVFIHVKVKCSTTRFHSMFLTNMTFLNKAIMNKNKQVKRQKPYKNIFMTIEPLI